MTQKSNLGVVARLVEDSSSDFAEPFEDYEAHIEPGIPGYEYVAKGLPPCVYEAFRKLLLKSRNKKIYNYSALTATRVFEASGGDLCFSYHGTVLIIAKPDDTTVLNTGGYSTLTTCRRINLWFRELGGWKVFIKNYRVWISNVIFPAPPVPFVDGMLILPEGALCRPVRP